MAPEGRLPREIRRSSPLALVVAITYSLATGLLAGQYRRWTARVHDTSWKEPEWAWITSDV